MSADTTPHMRAIVVGLQRGIPVMPRPFRALGESLGTDEATVLDVAQRMLNDGSARRFGAVFDARRLGYTSELCAIDVPEEQLDDAGAIVAAHPGITHAYLRGHPPGLDPFSPVPGLTRVPNLWFTLAVLADDFEAAMARLEASLAPYPILRLPAVRRFKIDVVFDPAQRDTAEHVPGQAPTHASSARDGFEPLSGADRVLVQALQGHLPPAPALFADAADRVGWPHEKLLHRLTQWQASGTLRRVALVLQHRRVGFKANAMCVWSVDRESVIEAGRQLAAWPAVTHCYERLTREGWPFNLYAMIHTATWPATRALFERLSKAIGAHNGRMLGSLREFKKTSMEYFGETESS